MNDAAILSGEFCSFKHIKTRKQFVIEIEFPEEMGQEVLRILGMPIGGQSKPVAIALLSSQAHNHAPAAVDSNIPQSLTQKAGILCNDPLYWQFRRVLDADEAKKALCRSCKVTSRKDISRGTFAGDRFLTELNDFSAWKRAYGHEATLTRFK